MGWESPPWGEPTLGTQPCTLNLISLISDICVAPLPFPTTVGSTALWELGLPLVRTAPRLSP